MALLNSTYRTIQSENFEPMDADDEQTVADGTHRKFMGLVALMVVAAAILATLFAVVS